MKPVKDKSSLDPVNYQKKKKKIRKTFSTGEYSLVVSYKNIL